MKSQKQFAFLILTSLIGTVPLLAQIPQLSANLQQLLIQPTSKLNTMYKEYNQQYVGALIKVNQPFNETPLSTLGVQIGTRAGAIYSVRIPVGQLRAFTQVKGIRYIQLDEPIGYQLDAARKSARVDSVHAGIQLPQAFTGKNVVVGIIDAGFDYSHPTFYDTTGTVLRIKRVWEQRNQGTPPQGFSYGNELTDTTQMIAEGAEVDSFSHGTHVGGIAAGSGYTGANNQKYRGVAYESDLVLVGIRPEKSEWTGMGMSSIVDAVNYIFTYAQSVGKPAVANLSWGCSIGPNDGTSLFAEALNELTGGGRIFVNSAGNNGDENIHLLKTFTATDTTLHSFVTFPTVNGEKRTWLDAWGEAGNTFEVQLRLFSGANQVIASSWITLNGETLDTFLIGNNADTLFFKSTAIASDFNGKPHVLFDLFSKTNLALCLSIKAKQGKVHAWLGYVQDYVGHYGAFSQNGQSWAVSGDNKYTLGEMSCASAAITVAAYASQIAFTNLGGNTVSYSGYAVTNQIVRFSSRGPTVDGRIKPDIAAPGMTLASAVNSYDISYAPNGDNYSSSVFAVNRNNRNYYYAHASGTSMSSPMAAGAIALLLQVNPALEPGRVLAILQKSALKDNFTTAKPDSSRWGAGKLNAYAAVKEALLTVGLQDGKDAQSISVQLYPNPTKGERVVLERNNCNMPIWVTVTDITGKSLETTIWLSNACETSIDTNHLKAGMYFVTLEWAGGKQAIKLLIQ
ncbi:MAG: S8 family peptidase [Bacteroidia bacterium]|jgi:subtilisin family serine protease|nr:S8 family peptidase [Bacteroidia bacterium]